MTRRGSPPWDRLSRRFRGSGCGDDEPLAVGPIDSGGRAARAHAATASLGAGEKEVLADDANWSWDDYVTVHEGSVRVSLAAAGVRDGHLESLFHYLMDAKPPTQQHCDLTIDLSGNCGISDYGVDTHLVPFLRKWPTCRRLKLYQTSVGDRTLRALVPWIAKGFVHELHLSDLNYEVTPQAVVEMLRDIHRGGRYPYGKAGGGRAPLWLRLEHNLLENADDIVAQARAVGAQIKVLGKAELSNIRPGDDMQRKGQENPEVVLVLFRLQQRRETIHDPRVCESHELLSLLKVGPGSGDAPASGQRAGWRASGGVQAWGGRTTAARVRHPHDPEPLSVDEMRLWEMETREDEEGGANLRNWQTFGEDGGWTFEENLAANSWLEHKYARHWSAEPAPPGAEGGRLASHARGGSSRSEAQSSASSSQRDMSSAQLHHVAKMQIEEAITKVLRLSPALQRLDFDGQVKQYLHAIRSKSGHTGVLEAIEVIRSAMVGKTRTSIRKLPAYLVTLLKRLLGECRNRSSKRTSRRESRREVSTSSAAAWLEGVREVGGESGEGEEDEEDGSVVSDKSTDSREEQVREIEKNTDSRAEHVRGGDEPAVPNTTGSGADNSEGMSVQ